jgi:hypothetical protein
VRSGAGRWEVRREQQWGSGADATDCNLESCTTCGDSEVVIPGVAAACLTLHPCCLHKQRLRCLLAMQLVLYLYMHVQYICTCQGPAC